MENREKETAAQGKEDYGIFDVKSIPFLEARIAEIRDMLKSRQVVDKDAIALLKNMLIVDERRLGYLKARL